MTRKISLLGIVAKHMKVEVDRMKRGWIMVLTCTVLACVISTQSVSGKGYPERPITLLTMVERYAQIDLLTRGLAKELSRELGQAVTVINRPGGYHGSLMARELLDEKADGYVLGVSATGAFTYSPHFIETAYGFEDFSYLTLLGLNQSGIVCDPGRPWESLKEAFEWAKKNEKPLTYMFQGSDDRDVMHRIAAAEGVDLLAMPSVGGPSIIQAVMGGHVDLGHLGAILFDYIETDRLKLLSATTPERLSFAGDVPTLREQGWDESVEMFVVLVAPRGLPEEARARLDVAVASLAENEEFQGFISMDLRMGSVPFGSEHAESYMREAHERFGRQYKESSEGM